MITEVYIIRHGSVDLLLNSNGQPLLYGPDASLGMVGEQQMRSLGKNLHALGISVDTVYASPLPRGRQSAAILSCEIGNPPIVVKDGLRATSYPSLEGKPLSEIEQLGEDFFVDEPLADVDARITKVFREIVHESRGGTIGIVTHEDEIGVLLHRLHHPESGQAGIETAVPNGQAYRLLVDSSFRLIEGGLISTEGLSKTKER